MHMPTKINISLKWVCVGGGGGGNRNTVIQQIFARKCLEVCVYPDVNQFFTSLVNMNMFYSRNKSTRKYSKYVDANKTWFTVRYFSEIHYCWNHVTFNCLAETVCPNSGAGGLWFSEDDVTSAEERRGRSHDAELSQHQIRWIWWVPIKNLFTTTAG